MNTANFLPKNIRGLPFFKNSTDLFDIVLNGENPTKTICEDVGYVNDYKIISSTTSNIYAGLTLFFKAAYANVGNSVVSLYPSQAAVSSNNPSIFSYPDPFISQNDSMDSFDIRVNGMKLRGGEILKDSIYELRFISKGGESYFEIRGVLSGLLKPIDDILYKEDGFYTGNDLELAYSVIKESGYDYILNILQYSIEDIQKIMLYMPLINYYKGSRKGVELVFQLIGLQAPSTSGAMLTEWFEPTAASGAVPYSVKVETSVASGKSLNAPGSDGSHQLDRLVFDFIREYTYAMPEAINIHVNVGTYDKGKTDTLRLSSERLTIFQDDLTIPLASYFNAISPTGWRLDGSRRLDGKTATPRDNTLILDGAGNILSGKPMQ